MTIAAATLRRLICLGSLGETSSLESMRILGEVGDKDEINRLHWQSWDDACEGLAVDDLSSLVRGLVLAEEHHRWAGGSVAGAIWVFRNLHGRAPFVSRGVADWVLARTSNPYMPFGTQNFGSSSLSGYVAAAEAHEYRIVQGLRETALSEAHASKERDKRSEAKVRAHLARRSGARSNFLAEFESLDVHAQLRKLADDDVFPVEYYPTSLAYAASQDVLNGLNRELRIRLLRRLKGRRRGPWSAFKRRLRGTFDEELGTYGMPWDRKRWF